MHLFRLLIGLCLWLSVGVVLAQQVPQKVPIKPMKAVKPPAKASQSKKAAVQRVRPSPKPAAKVLTPSALTPRPDTLKADSLLAIAPADTSKKGSVTDSAKTGDIKTTVAYQAQDSIVFDVTAKMARMYGGAAVTYGDINLTSDKINVDWTSGILNAEGTPDTTGKLQGQPFFKQGAEQFTAKKMRYNFKSRRGLISEVVTQQGDGYIHGQVVKRESEKAFYLKNAEYTTCNLEHPHFYIKSYKMKMVPGKKIISGPFDLHIADVPTPLGFAFGFFPIPKYKASGVIIPTYGESSTLGFFLRQGGYYFAINDYVDLKVLGEFYTLGGWGLTPQSSYRKRYKYDGNVSVRYNRRRTRQTNGLYALRNEEFWGQWSHTPQSKGSSRFSASVQAGTNGYNRSYSQINQNRFSSQFNSTVSYSKTFTGTPFSVAVSARSTQNTSTRAVSVDLPTFSAQMNRIYPFKRPTSVKSNGLTNLNLAYTLTGQNTITNERANQSLNAPGGGVRFLNVVNPNAITIRADGAIELKDGTIQYPNGFRELPDGTIFNNFGQISSRELLNSNTVTTGVGRTIIPFTVGSLPLLLRQASLGVQHNVPISTTLRVGRYFNLNPSLNYRETWYPRKLSFSYNEQLDRVVVDTVQQFSRFYDFSASASLTTQIYGTFFVRRGNVEAIRHRINPTVGFSASPNFEADQFGFFQRLKVDSSRRVVKLDPYQGFVYGGPRRGPASGSINFAVSNQVEMKLRNVSDSGKTTYTKKSLIDNLSIQTNYNLAADSFNLSPVGLSLATRVLNAVVVSINGSFDPYSYENRPISGTNGLRNEVRRPTYAFATGQGIKRLGRLTFANLALSYDFNPSSSTSKPKSIPRRTLSQAEQQELDFINANPNMFVDFTLPWSLGVNYNGSYRYNPTGPKATLFTHNLQLRGDISLSPKWKIGAQAPYDFQTKRFASTSINIYRDLHCWEMRAMVQIFGTAPMYTFDINVKASILQDLKLSKRNSYYDR